MITKLQFNINAGHSEVSQDMQEIYNKVKEAVENNGTHLEMFKTVKFGTWGEFRETIRKKEKATVLENYIAELDSINPISIIIENNKEVGYTFNEKYGHLDVYFNGRVVKTDLKYNKKSSTTGDLHNGHLRTTIFDGQRQTPVMVERLVFIAHAIRTNNIPLSLRGLQVNVMDLSGNPDTAKKLGITPNFNPDNLEWAFDRDNSAHYSTVMTLYKWFGLNYKISANDRYLYELVRLGNINNVKEYLSWFN